MPLIGMPVLPIQRAIVAEVSRAEVSVKYEHIEQMREEYQERMDRLTPDGAAMGSVNLPSEETSSEGLRAFNDLMLNHGFTGIQYCQEALHSEGEDYFDQFESQDEVMDDYDLALEVMDE